MTTQPQPERPDLAAFCGAQWREAWGVPPHHADPMVRWVQYVPGPWSVCQLPADHDGPHVDELGQECAH